jgi:membrane-associated phospholipid phosphatase
MAEAGAARRITPPPKPEAAAIAPRPVRRRRAVVFQFSVLAASVLFVGLAVIARFVPYFPIDLKITLAVQRWHGQAFAQLMYGLSWLGFPPQVYIIAALAVVLLFAAGLRWEAVMTAFAALNTALGTLVKIIVNRPRPSPDLVHVIQQLPTNGFPSGHVLAFTAFCGFLAFLTYTLLKPSWGRVFILTVLGLIIGLMGLSRIYQGAHWFSDVMGAYLLGSLWLALTIKLYRWGKPRFFKGQRTAQEVPNTPAVAAR